RMFLARHAETFFEFGRATTLEPRTIGAEGDKLADAPAGVFCGASVRIDVRASLSGVPDRLDALSDTVSQSPQDANGQAGESLVKSFQSDTWTPSLVQCDGTERFGGLKAFDLRVAAAPSYGEQRQHQRLQVPARLATATRLRNRNGLMPLLPHLRREKLTQR